MSKQQLKTTGLGMSLELGLSKRAIGVVVVSLLALTGIVGVSQEAKADTSHCTPGNITLPLDGGDLVIETKAQLMHFSISQDLYRSSDIVLRPSIGDTLDVSDCTWIPVGRSIFDVNDPDNLIADEPFTGRFDGAGNTVIFQHIADDDEQGFFGWIQNAVVSDLQLEGTMSADDARIGGLAGVAENSEIENSSFRGTVYNEDNSRTGGLVGHALNTSITNSSFEGSVVVEQQAQRAGGLVGYAENSTITNSRSEADVSSDKFYSGRLGGLIGYANNSYIEGSSSTGDVEAGGGDSAGGLVGEALNTSIINSSFEGSVTSTADFVGGLVGESTSSDVFASHSVGTVTGADSVGGLVGLLRSAKVEESYSSSVVVATGTAVGGLVGLMDDGDGSSATVEYSYASGSVTSTGIFVGGLVGESVNSDVFASYAHGAVVGHDIVGGLAGDISQGSIMQSYSVGSVQADADATDFGGFLGYNDGADLIANFWDVETSGFATSLDAAPTELEGLSSQAMKTIAPYTADALVEAAWGIVPATQFSAPLNNTSPPPSPLAKPDGTSLVENWGIGQSVNSGYPFLWWQTDSAVEQAPTGGSISTGGGFSAPPQTTITSSGTNLTVNLNKTRVLRLSGSNLNLVTEARVGGKNATINFGRSNANTLVISKLPLLPSGKYTLTLLTPTGLVAAEVEVGIIAKITRLRGIEASGKLSSQVRSAIRKQNLTYASAGTLRCWGVTTSSSASELALAKQKAEAACAYAKKRNPELDVVESARTGTGKPARNQAVKLRYLK